MSNLNIFTMVNHGSLIKIQCMADSKRYLETSLARTIDSHPGYVNAHDVASTKHKKEIEEMMKILGVIYYVTRHSSNSWVKQSWLLKALNLTKSQLTKYTKILEDGIKYKGAGGYIQERMGEDGQTWYQINNFDDYNKIDHEYYLPFLAESNQLQSGFPTIFVAEFENKVDKYHDTGVKKNITLMDIGEFSVHDVDECFEIILKLINENLFPTPVDASALNASKVKDRGAVVFENAYAMF